MAMLGLKKLPSSVVLVGIMGVGKTSIGKKLARSLSVPFKDSDQEVEAAAGFSVANIYKWYGKENFQDAEHRVMKRLLQESPQVISTGVETFINPENFDLIKSQSFSIWLKADLETLLPRLERRNHRPQLEHVNKRQALEAYLEKYSPVYEKADLMISCDRRDLDDTVQSIMDALAERFWPVSP